MAGYGQNKKKLRFKIRQMEFADVCGLFHSIPGAHTEYKLELSRTQFDNYALPLIHNDCIAFSQLLKMKGLSYRDLREPNDAENAFRELQDDFMTLSFSGIRGKAWGKSVRVSPRPGDGNGKTRDVTATVEFLAERAFLDGFSVRNGETGDTVRYVRFAASANMTRHGKVMYVKADYEPELSRRVTLGLEENGCLSWAKGLTPSKWDAYKGLCLSDGYALAELKEINPAPGAPELSEAGVAFVNDMKWKNIIAAPCEARPLCFRTETQKDGFIAVAPLPLDSEESQKAFAKEREKAVLTDGVGLIAPEAAQWISKALCGDPEAVTTFQLRLPFVKGMAHRVDFRAYLAERGVTRIRDAWGNQRLVSSVWLILPRSMFKADKWFMQQARRVERKESEAPALYHEKLREYGHDLVISQRFIPKTENAEPLRLNYEVLQTCGMTQAEFDALLSENLKQYAMLRLDELTRLRWLTGGNPPEEAEEEWDEDFVDEDKLSVEAEGEEAGADGDSGEDSDEDNPDDEDDEDKTVKKEDSTDVRVILAEAVRKNPSLLYSNKAKELLNDACNALAFGKLLRGKLALPNGSTGESRYLSCDLGRYLDYLASLGDGEKGAYFRPLSPGEFYAPGFRSVGACCALFRTPHYSRNEHLLLRPLPDGADPSRERWFGHLRGVLMIPPEGFAAARLGGADFDGDHVSVVDDSLYVGALERSLGLSSLDDAERNRLGGSALPFIVIPSAHKDPQCEYNWEGGGHLDEAQRKKERESLGDKEFRAFQHSCENRIGTFSNYAFLQGAAAYGEKSDKDAERRVQTLTALAGMEIDAAKTGKTPALPKEMEEITSKDSAFLSIKQGVKRAQNPRWEKPKEAEKKGFFLEREWEERREKRNCPMDGIPEKVIDAHKKPKEFLDSWTAATKSGAFQFSACFDFTAHGSAWNGVISEQMLVDLHYLYKAYLEAGQRLYFQSKRRGRKPYSPDLDLKRILWPRFAVDCDADSFDRAFNFCERFFADLNREQRKTIRTAFQKPLPFEQTRESRESKLMESLHAIVDFYPEQTEDWETLREQLLNFNGNGFCLPYLMLRAPKSWKPPEPNPYREELRTCKTRKALLEKALELAKLLCAEAFPECAETSILTPLAAHLAQYADEKRDSSGSESFFWTLLGANAALSYLREEPTKT